MALLTREQINNKLKTFSSSLDGIEGSALIFYKWFFERAKNIYFTLNMFHYADGYFTGLFWCPNSKRAETEAILESAKKNKALCSGLKEVTGHDKTPPTYFRTNDFIRPFQDIVFTYGVPSYQEANPTLFTIVTFPLLFGIMFGDFAHGLVLLTLSSYICLRKDHLIKTKSMLADAVDSRYLLLMMGFFSAFSGFLYNDFAAVPLNFIPSCYQKNEELKIAEKTKDPSCVYPIGLDPMWYAAENELQYVNSFKMKISVIIGVAQMIIGIIFKGMNAVHFNSSIDFFFEFIPQIIFMVAFFGYMNFMIIIKWVTDWSSKSFNAPSIITLLIGIPLKGSDPGDIPLYGTGALQQAIGQWVLRNQHLLQK